MPSLPQTRGQTYRALRNALRGKGLPVVAHITRVTGLSKSAVEQRMAARQPWHLPEMYQVLDSIGCQHSRLAELFPADPYEEVAV